MINNENDEREYVATKADKKQGSKKKLADTTQTEHQTDTDPRNSIPWETYAPTSHTSNELTKQVLDVMPQRGPEVPGLTSEASGAPVKVLSSEKGVTLKKAEWAYGIRPQVEEIEEEKDV